MDTGLGGRLLVRREILPHLCDEAAGHDQGNQVDPASAPVGRGGRDAVQEDVRSRIADHPGERLRRAVRAEYGPLLGLGGDPREQARGGRAQQRPGRRPAGSCAATSIGDPAGQRQAGEPGGGQDDPDDDQPRLAEAGDEPADQPALHGGARGPHRGEGERRRARVPAEAAARGRARRSPRTTRSPARRGSRPGRAGRPRGAGPRRRSPASSTTRAAWPGRGAARQRFGQPGQDEDPGDRREAGGDQEGQAEPPRRRRPAGSAAGRPAAARARTPGRTPCRSGPCLGRGPRAWSRRPRRPGPPGCSRRRRRRASAPAASPRTRATAPGSGTRSRSPPG